MIFMDVLSRQTRRALWRGRRHNPGTSEKGESLWALPSQFAAPDLPVWVLRVLGERHHMYANRQTTPTLQSTYDNRLCVSDWQHRACLSVYRQGDIGTSWYAVLSGSLDVKVSETSYHQVKADLKIERDNYVTTSCHHINGVTALFVIVAVVMHFTL